MRTRTTGIGKRWIARLISELLLTISNTTIDRRMKYCEQGNTFFEAGERRACNREDQGSPA